MDFSQQTTAIVNAIKNLPPEIVEQDSLNIVGHQYTETGNEYIVLWVQRSN